MFSAVVHGGPAWRCPVASHRRNALQNQHIAGLVSDRLKGDKSPPRMK